ncbi:hypothetical protein DPEC_G00170970 [Dallia pectoralis]|uniref:Uncharacterized protein n=1 Tax=Dallia pectoralis TaxID=75939 RepID=A0ACC2GDM4_DALPE|nr:hypothetical protein DPEC_G00170970 [Dallia pectoralis]
MIWRTTGSGLVVFLWSLTVVLGQYWDVTYSPQSICVLKGSTVKLSCTYKYPSGHKVTETYWFIKNDANKNPVNLKKDSEYTDRVTYRDEGKKHSLTITDLRETDSAEYKFRFTTNQPGGKWIGYPGVTLHVTDGPRNPSVSVSPSGEIVEGSSVTLTCSSDANPPVYNYTWYKTNVTSPKASGQSYNIRIRVAVLVLIFCLSGFIWFWKRGCKSPSDTTNQTDDGQRDSSPVYDNISDMVMTSTAARTTDTDNQDDLH